MSDLLEKRTIQERLVISKTLLETVLDDLPSELSNNSPKLDKEIGECNDCIKHGGDWECDRVHCHKGNVPDTNVGELISRQGAIDAMCWACGYDCDKSKFVYNAPQDEQVIMSPEHYVLSTLLPAQPETAKRIVGKSRDGMTLWYQCDMCNEPVDVQDNYCRGCGRRLIDE